MKLPPGGIVLGHPYAAPYSNRSFVVPTSWYRDFNKDLPVPASALRADLPVLHFLLQKAYAGYQPAAARGWNWHTMFREWDAQLARAGSRKLSLKDAFAAWGRLERVQVDNHSGVPGLTAFDSGSASALLARNPQSSCSALRFDNGTTEKLSPHDAGQQPHDVQKWDGSKLTPAWYVSYPKAFGTASALQCGARTIALTAVSASAPLSQTPVYQMLADGIAYLRLPTFTDATKAAIRSALSKAPDLGKERAVIFDLRGNAGGSAPSDILTNWFAESAIEIAGSTAQDGTNSCFTAGLSFGLQQQFVANLKPPVSAGLQQVLQQLVDGLKGSATQDCAVEPQVQTADHTLADHRLVLHANDPGQTRVIALVDGGCGSECEYLTYVLGNLPDTVIVGSSTYGVMGFTQTGYFVLPHSRVPFRIAMARTQPYGDTRSVEGYGLHVDVLLPTAQSQSEAALTALARALTE